MYLAPGTCEPLDTTVTGTIVADLGVCRPLVATPLQREAADVVGQAKNSTGSDTHPTFSRALQGKRMITKVGYQSPVCDPKHIF